ncbi:hypothetical protein AAD018_011950 [Aestuariibius insulae]|uniref:hypothetical protein n=1 Tax=Aestuariibius insulae TaxID=2058287 RepID=UPI00345EAD72
MKHYAPRPSQEARPVLERLDPFQARVVAHLRWWSDGPSGQDMVRLDYRTALGAAETEEAVGLLDAVITLVGDNARRPLKRQQSGCQCIGSDEALFARLVALAGHHLHEDATRIAAELVTGARAEQMAILAAGLGRYMKCLKPHVRPARLH